MIIIDYKDAKPIYEQVVDRFKLLIVNGVLKPDDKMPSVRSLAMDLSINPNTIQRAYAELERQGYVYTVMGRGNFVSDMSTLKDDYKKEVFDSLDEICDTAISIGMTSNELTGHIEAYMKKMSDRKHPADASKKNEDVSIMKNDKEGEQE